MAEIFIRLLYVFWFLHCGLLASAVLYTGIRLVWLLQSHLKKFKTSAAQEQKIQAGLFKIRSLVAVLVLALAGFAVFLLLYGILRDQIIRNTRGSYALCTIWNFLGPVASCFACLAVITNPHIDDKPTLGLPQSNGNTSSSNQSTSTASTDIQDVLSADALNRLEKIKANCPPKPDHYHIYHHTEDDDGDDDEVNDIPLQLSRSNLIPSP
ncbi:hypothetical protein BC941DRAFT_475498 [Chlamydoabsidia padenii]|nr:hypothetical protein BC941DRAFT_475498 [Chlamydoabsidia padenii]